MIRRDPKSPISNLRSGFSLPEIMFAVMILGIGFIMVAAMFPVAIQQAKANKESVTATMVAQRAMRCLEQAGDSLTFAGGSVLVANGGVYAYQQNLGDPAAPVPNVTTASNLWNSIRGEMIEPSDPRFAWTALYSRAAGSNTADVVVFVVGCQEATQYENADVGLPGAYPWTLFNLQPRLLEARSSGTRIRFQEATAGSFGSAAVPADYTTYGAMNALADGGFVVVANGAAAGRVLQLTDYDSVNADWGVRVNDDVSPLAAWTPVWVMGRTFNGTGYVGKAQDIAVYKGVVRTR